MPQERNFVLLAEHPRCLSCGRNIASHRGVAMAPTSRR